ncbi:phospholipid/cholesterol/gamma-HCH transport system permease protein [Dysgonomonas sp. PH5-45]|uniref:MlaE family ABC transporter permease n=1 Tax=unclassified Dysgonomonas TaxID=2630389 RepID=UPI0024763240|nr:MULTISPECIES: ABC transporter permease [unclassified Dysgonomonas]MDH6353983.1 phospholipid/cholesterol/gamma-HCH transport system permease protein [Dysgonomonas sp. PH5-45]MDH6386885.1 phospholipid/cholesterol/gamma-HCH transport system permease protein [Dysgonomonas sp. PH5-37]
MFLSTFFEKLGQYVLLMSKVFTKPQKWSVFFRQFVQEINKLGVGSIGIVILISFFIGAVIVVQIKLNIDNPIMPRWTVGYVSREIILLEFSSSIMFLILAGKVGSNIASEIGTIRITEQIDALEIMGVNSANYLILPKTLALMVFTPVLVTFSIFAGVVGGFVVAGIGHIMPVADLEFGFQSFFKPFYVWYAIIKSIFFAYIVATVASYYGYYARGGSLDVGKASTNSVVMSSILILASDLVITQLMMG